MSSAQPVAGRAPAALLAIATLTVLAIYATYMVVAVSSASKAFGCDYLTYDAGARSWLSGVTPYPIQVAEAGTCGIFQYPPPFLLGVAPFTLLSPAAANWLWTGMLTLCVPLAALAMPIPPLARLVVLALAGTSWPVVFAVRVGAIGPLLLLLFALAWRWADRPGRLAAVTVVGGFAKVLPGLLVGWMLLTRRWRAAGLSIGVAVVVGLLWLVLQPWMWSGFLDTERLVADAVIRAPLNVSPAALAYFSGVPQDPAQLLGLAHALVVVGFAAAVAIWRSADGSVVVAAIASQAIAPVVWDHYAIVVFLAVGWLLARRQWWAVLLGLSMTWTLILWFQPWQWVAAMDGAMVAVAAVDWWEARRAEARPLPAIAAAGHG
jgi:alpha-1,2-mannosyltransferase